MKSNILILAFSLIISFNSISQIIFEKGYFINDSNQKVECLIKNLDWKNNPTEFEYMLNQDAIVEKATIETVKEFGIKGISSYLRANVKIDRSSDDVNFISSERNPIFSEEQLFLKVLISDKASLYVYEDGNLTRYFYSINNFEIKQLVFKQYLNKNKIMQNDNFKQQLLVDLECQAIKLNDVEILRYSKRDLERFFIKYNECKGSSQGELVSKQKKDFFNLSIRPGLTYSLLSINNSSTGSVDFNNKISFRFGIEAELILPFNKNKWSIITEPTYQYYKSEGTLETTSFSGGYIVLNVDYKSIELPIGIRHYFFLNDKSKIFLDVSCIFDFSNNSFVKFTRIDGSEIYTLDVKSRVNLGLGMGYKFKDKYSLGIRYQTSREILSEYVFWNTSYRTFSISLGYSLF